MRPGKRRRERAGKDGRPNGRRKHGAARVKGRARRVEMERGG